MYVKQYLKPPPPAFAAKNTLPHRLHIKQTGKRVTIERKGTCGWWLAKS
jgi:hypothetical protein